jgi:hypothetical protein
LLLHSQNVEVSPLPKVTFLFWKIGDIFISG